MRVRAPKILERSLRPCGSRWTTTTKAAPVASGKASKNASSAFTPPAEAPMPTITGFARFCSVDGSRSLLASPSFATPPILKTHSAARASLTASDGGERKIETGAVGGFAPAPRPAAACRDRKYRALGVVSAALEFGDQPPLPRTAPPALYDGFFRFGEQRAIRPPVRAPLRAPLERESRFRRSPSARRPEAAARL